MKKIFVLLFAAVMCLSFAACGVSDNTDNADDAELQKTEPTASLTPNPVESDPVDTAPTSNDDVSNNSTEASTENYETIELTVENWDTYFELVTVATWDENAFGEAECLRLNNYYKLRDKYRDLCASVPSIAIEYSYIMSEKKCTIDYETRTYTIHEEFTYGPFEQNEIDDHVFTSDSLGYAIELSWDRGGCHTYESEIGYNYDFKVLRVQGTLCLINE